MNNKDSKTRSYSVKPVGMEKQSKTISYSPNKSIKKPDVSFKTRQAEEMFLEESEMDESINPHGFMLFIKGSWRPVAVFLLSLAIVISIVLIGYQYIYQHYISPVDPNDNTPIEISIKRGTSLSGISKALEEAGVIQNSTVFKFYTDFSDMTSKLKAGTYQLSKNMTMDEIILALSRGDGQQNSIWFTLIEGASTDGMAEALFKNKKIADMQNFLNLVKTGESFFDYSFLDGINPNRQVEEGEEVKDYSKRKYLLDGYLFPSTYNIYVGASEDTVIRKMLEGFSQVYNEKYVERTKELNMTIDEVVILASIIQKEGKPQDFKKISAVFHNRLEIDMLLQSDATVGYALGIAKLKYNAEEKKTESPYNTYLYKGLPIGPICNPGQSAIDAALNPSEEYIKDGYFFFLTDPKTGDMIPAKTYEEHLKNIKTYLGSDE